MVYALPEAVLKKNKPQHMVMQLLKLAMAKVATNSRPRNHV